MTAIEYILDGLEAELALERELGNRVCEIDRSLLVDLGSDRVGLGSDRVGIESGRVGIGSDRVGIGSGSDTNHQPPATNHQSPATNHQPPTLCFLHDRPPTAAGVDMMDKITSALKLEPSSVPVVDAPPMPKAKVYIILGSFALRKWFPGRNLSPGQHFRTDSGAEVFVTYSPNYILRYKVVTPALVKIKQSMWTTIKQAARAAAT